MRSAYFAVVSEITSLNIETNMRLHPNIYTSPIEAWLCIKPTIHIQSKDRKQKFNRMQSVQ